MFIKKKIEVHRKQTKGQHKTKKNNQQKKHAIYENSKQCCEGCESKKIGIAVMRARTRENSNTTSPPLGCDFHRKTSTLKQSIFKAIF